MQEKVQKWLDEKKRKDEFILQKGRYGHLALKNK